jgi:hypothetical protein
MFGTNEKFNLVRAAFLRSGCGFYIFEDYYSHLLRLTNYKPSAMVLTSPYLFNLRLFSGDTELPYTYFCNAGSLRMDCDSGFAQFVFTDSDQLRVRGKGVTLRIELCPAVAEDGMTACHGVRPVPGGLWEAVFGTLGKLLFKPLKGRIDAYYPWINEKCGYDAVIFDLKPDENGEFEAAIHDDMVEFDISCENYPPFDELVSESLKSFEEFKKIYRKPAKGYEQLFEYTAYEIWGHRTMVGGGYKEPGILFQSSLASVFSWQQSYHGMAMLNDTKEAWRQICLLFLYQNAKTGQLPATVSYVGGGSGGSNVQPCIQGFALDALIRYAGDSFLTPEECERMYPKFKKWLEFWLTYRNAGRGDDVTAINSPHDSGWDDASIFKDGFPTINPDVISFVIEMMYMTARLARGCGKTEEADSWTNRADKLLNTLVTEFWDGEKFVTYLNGKPVDSMSLACYQPIMLGDRLPQHIIDKVAERLTEEGDFLSEIGLCTESLKSPLCDYGANTFVSGRVVAPPHQFMTVGLNLAGKKKEAALIARRWCDNVDKNGIILGFAPYEYYKLTGKKANITYGPVASDGWSWSPWASAATMIMITKIIPDADELE